MNRRAVLLGGAAGPLPVALGACVAGGGGTSPEQGDSRPALKSGMTRLMMQNGTQPEGEKKLQVLLLGRA